MDNNSTPIPATLPLTEDARARVLAVNDTLSDDAVGKIVDLMAKKGCQPELLEVLFQKRGYGSMKGKCPLREFTLARLLAEGGPAEYTCQAKPAGQGAFSHSWVEQAWGTPGGAAPAATTAAPQGVPAAAVDAIMRRLEAMEARMIQSTGAGQPQVRGGVLDQIKEFGAMFAAMREVMQPPKAASLLDELEKMKALQGFIKDAAGNGGAVAAEDVEEHWATELAKAAGPHLPRLIEGLSARLLTPAATAPATGASTAADGSGQRRGRVAHTQHQAAPVAGSPAPTLKLSEPMDIGDAVQAGNSFAEGMEDVRLPTEAERIEACHNVIRRLVPAMAQTPEMCVDALVKASAAETAEDAAASLLDIINDDDAAEEMLRGYQVGELAALLAMHPKLATVDHWLMNVEACLRAELADTDDADVEAQQRDDDLLEKIQKADPEGKPPTVAEGTDADWDLTGRAFA